MNVRTYILFGIVLLVAAVGCQAVPESPVQANPERLDPQAQIVGSTEGVARVKIGYVNRSKRTIRENEAFEGRWQLVTEDDEIRAAGHLYHLGTLEPGEAAYPMAWEAKLDPSTYRLLWGAPTIGSLVTRFTVEVDGDAVNVLEMSPVQVTDAFPPPFVE